MATLPQAHETIQQCKIYSFDELSMQCCFCFTSCKKTPVKKRGRLLAASNDENLQPVSKRNVGTALPTADVRYDQHARWPIDRDKNIRFILFSSSGNDNVYSS